jgi:uncharacterized alpha-E superfamily protein
VNANPSEVTFACFGGRVAGSMPSTNLSGFTLARLHFTLVTSKACTALALAVTTASGSVDSSRTGAVVRARVLKAMLSFETWEAIALSVGATSSPSFVTRARWGQAFFAGKTWLTLTLSL